MKSAFKRNSIGFFYSPNSNSHIPHSNIGFTIVELPSSLKFRRASLVPNNNVKQGFTIVELLVVIVVIGILAAITIVSYTGISGRAINSSVKSDISQAYKQLEISKTTSSTDAYPVDQASANLKSSNGTTYTYYSDSPYKSYCLVATNNSTVYSVSSSNPLPISGNCLSNGLTLNLDAGNTASYPGSGTTWTDLSGLGNDGTLVNGVGYSSANGGALTFDGVDDYVRLPETGSLPVVANGSFSISSWSKVTSKITTHNIVRRDNNANQGAESRMVISLATLLTSGYASFGFYNGTSYSAVGTTDRTNGNWHYFVGIYDSVGKNVYLYVDGILEASNLNVTPSSSFNTAREPWVIGSVNTINSYGEDMLGFIPIVQIYNRALSSAEITQNFSATKSRYGL